MNKTLPISVNQAVFDSGASLSYIPTKEFRALISLISKVKDC